MPDSAAYEAHASPEAYTLFCTGSEFLATGHPGAAAVVLERAAALAPGKNSIREALARAYYALGRHDRAAELFGAIAEDVPTNDYAQFGLGCSLVALGRVEEGCGKLRLAAVMNPGRAEYAERLADAERRLPPAETV
jgi:tetratricopeptide (TPR) repeat protein